jgi:hypothetical protein
VSPGRRYLDSKLVGAVGSQGISVALSADSNTVILGGRNDILAPGAAWLFVQPVATVLPYLQRATRDRPLAVLQTIIPLTLYPASP